MNLKKKREYKNSIKHYYLRPKFLTEPHGALSKI